VDPALRIRPFLFLAGAVLLLGGACGKVACASDLLTPIDLPAVTVGGEIGRRIGVTVNHNLLVTDIEKDFLAPYREKRARDGYTGLGKLIDATVRFAAYTKNEKVIALKKRFVEETIKTQGPDGYIGMMEAPTRTWGMWDIHAISISNSCKRSTRTRLRRRARKFSSRRPA
jgi:hypothetical protein